MHKFASAFCSDVEKLNEDALTSVRSSVDSESPPLSELSRGQRESIEDSTDKMLGEPVPQPSKEKDSSTWFMIRGRHKIDLVRCSNHTTRSDEALLRKDGDKDWSLRKMRVKSKKKPEQDRSVSFAGDYIGNGPDFECDTRRSSYLNQKVEWIHAPSRVGHEQACVVATVLHTTCT